MQSAVGDFVGVKGGVKRTDKGELSVLVAEALPAEAWRKGRASSLHTACCEQVHSRLSEFVAWKCAHPVGDAALAESAAGGPSEAVSPRSGVRVLGVPTSARESTRLSCVSAVFGVCSLYAAPPPLRLCIHPVGDHGSV